MKDVSCSDCLANLAVASRMKIFLFLKENGKQSVSTIVEKFKLSQPTISYHLKNMNQIGLLSKERASKEIFYAVDEKCPNDHKICSLKQFNFNK